MVRLGLDARGHLVPKVEGGGRSAWVLPQLGLLRKLEAKPEMARRSLRQTPRGADGLVDAVALLLAERVALPLALAWRSGTVRLPESSSRTPLVELVAWQAWPDGGGAMILPWDEAGVGCLLGRARIQRLVATDSQPVRTLLLQLRRWHGLGYAPAPLAAPSFCAR